MCCSSHLHGKQFPSILKGGLSLKPPKFEHIFVAVITLFSPFFCANTLEDISKHASVTQKMALPNLWQT